MKLGKFATGVGAAAMLASGFAAVPTASADVYIPLLTYRTGPFAGSGTRVADGMHDYLTMLNERDGGIGGARLIVEECETGYTAQKGVECYEGTKSKGAVVYNPYSTGIALQLIPKAPVDGIPILTMGYGLSATAVGEKFPWVFSVPLTYWSGLSAIVRYIDLNGGVRGRKIGYVYLDVGYGREPIPLLDDLAEEMGFDVVKIPVGVKEMQNQSSHWLQIRKERPDWVIMWGWGAMNPTAVKEAAKTGYPMDRFIGGWWSGGDVDVVPAGAAAKGYKAANFHGTGADFAAIRDILKYVVRAGKSQAREEDVGMNFYNGGVMNAMVVAEAIRTAQGIAGRKDVTGEDVRRGLEALNLTAARLEEIGFGGFVGPMKVTCADHAGAHPIFIQQWDGKAWNRVSDWIEPMKDRVRPKLLAAADRYVADKPGWETQSCD